MAGPPAGWYRPTAESQSLQWWDGQQWTEHHVTPPMSGEQPTSGPGPGPDPGGARPKGRGWIVAVVAIVAVVGIAGAALLVLRGGGTPVDRLAGASGECLGTDDTRDLEETGWMRPGQADFRFEVSDDARSMEVTTVDDPVGENPSASLTWTLEDVDGSSATLRLDDATDSGLDEGAEIELEYRVEDGELVVEADFSEIWGQDESKTFEADLDDVEAGDFRAAVRTGGVMTCTLD